ncbi:MAG: MFS transporter [Rhizobiales bacterium]|nr:MFS transporter [Hyphomicrobiales bacterium]
MTLVMASPSRFSVIVPLIVGCAQFMHQFDGSVIATALPAMAQSLNEDPLVLNLAITCYLLALAVFVPISGWMADRYGAKHVFLAAIAVFTTSSVLCGLSSTLAEIVVWRTVQGIGGAMMTPVGRVIVVKSVPKFEIVRAMNYITIPAVLGPLIGPSVGGFIVTHLSWHWIFFLNVPIGIAGLFLVYRHVPDLRDETVAPLDLRGFILIGLALAGLVFGFSAIGRGPVPTAIIIVAISIGAICGTAYLAHARRKADPIIDFGLLRVRLEHRQRHLVARRWERAVKRG